jgi:hypothetical protein
MSAERFPLNRKVLTVKIIFRAAIFGLLFIILTSCNLGVSATNPPGAAPATHSAAVLATASTAAAVKTPYTPNTIYGFYASTSAAASQDTVSTVQRLGAGWVRLNLATSNPSYVTYLASGINVVLTVLYREPANIVTDNGTPQEYIAAGFPFKSKAQYQQDIRTFLQPALKYLKSGRQVWVQAGNEIADATVVTKAPFWRGTMEQYLAQQQAFYEAVKSLDPDIKVVQSGFQSETMDVLLGRQGSGYASAMKYMNTLLAPGDYDAIDLHFYGCVEDIPGKVKAIKALLPAGHTVPWISTENGGPNVECKTTPISWSQDLTEFEKVQAQQVPARLSACTQQGGSVCLWFSLFNIKVGSDAFNHLGLLDEDTTPPRQKPAYAAFQAFIAQQK